MLIKMHTKEMITSLIPNRKTGVFMGKLGI